jgi:glycosyltransferase involved in cell wall biosynthesis
MIQILEIITVATLSTSIIYWLVILVNISRHKNKTDTPDQAISIVVCAHNEIENLKRLIPVLLTQEYANFEIVIVDDRSDDGTYDYLLKTQSEQLRYVRVDQVHDHINAKKYALTLGIRAAKNDILIFTDADCIPKSKHWVTSIARTFTNETEYVLGVSQYEKQKGFLSQFIRYETQTTAMNYIGFALAGNPYMGVGRNLSYRKSSFLKNKGFNKIQHITGGDDDLLVNQWANKKNTEIVIGNDALTHSVPKSTWEEYRIQKTRHWSVGKYYKLKDKILLGIQNLSHLVFWLALIILATRSDNYIFLAAILFLRVAIVTLLYNITSKRFGDRINPWLVPIIDLLYVLYASFFGFVALFTRKVKWKK